MPPTKPWRYLRAHPEREVYFFSHAGGTIPYLATRFSIIDEMNVIPGAEERGPRLTVQIARTLSHSSNTYWSLQ